MRRSRTAIGALALLGALVTAAPAGAVPFTVTRFDDPVPNACALGDCSLREAIRAANAAAGADSIALGAGTYQLSQVGTGEDAALDGDLDVTDDLTLTGAGITATVIDGNGSTTLERVLSVDPTLGPPNVTLALADLMVTDGTGSFGAGLLAENEAVTTVDRVSISSNLGSSFGVGIFNEDDAVMTIRDSVVADNRASGSFSAGIMNQNDARMTIERTAISGNVAAGGFAGGVMNQNAGVMTIRDSTIAENAVGGRGGGLFLQNDSVTRIESSTVSENTSNSPSASNFEVGAGLAVQNNARVTLVNTTVSGNSADDAGGGIHLQNAPVVRLENTTVSANLADVDGDASPADDGGGLFVASGLGGSLTLVSSLVAQNTNAAAPDCSGAVASAGFNLIGNAQGCAFVAAAGDHVGSGAAPIAAQLGPLVDNGGPTETHLPALASPAIDAGVAGGLTLDQRGRARPSDLATVPNPAGADATDIGSVELQAAELEGSCRGQAVVKVDGTAGDDTLVGTEATDLINGLAGNDSVNGAGGDDCVNGDDGNDTAKGGAGADQVNGGAGKDKVKGGAGNDPLSGAAGKDRLSGGAGKDKLTGGPGKDKLQAGGGKDKLKAADGEKDKVNCGGGDDKATVDKKDKVGASCEKVAVRS